jgi:hypothetical protein
VPWWWLLGPAAGERVGWFLASALGTAAAAAAGPCAPRLPVGLRLLFSLGKAQQQMSSYENSNTAGGRRRACWAAAAQVLLLHPEAELKSQTAAKI